MSDLMQQTCEGSMNMPTNTVGNSTDINLDIVKNMDRVKLSDSSDGLELYCYTHCVAEDPDILKKCRGIVFDGEKVILNAFPYTEEVTAPFFSSDDPNYIPDFSEIIEKLGDLNQYTFYEAHEGAVIRVFHHKGVWYTSTHRKLNAEKSKWASKESFGQMFKDALTAEELENTAFSSRIAEGEMSDGTTDIISRFCKSLETEKQYMFLVRNNSGNRIVCDAASRPTVFHVGTFVDGELRMDIDVGIPYPKKYTVSDINDLGDAVYNTNYKETQGLIAFGPNNTQIKIFNPSYSELFDARGNEPSINFRYLQVRMDQRKVDMLYHLYPNSIKDFEEYENRLYEIAKNINKAYVFRYIKRKHVTIPKEEYEVMKGCHAWHCTDRQSNRVNLTKIIELMNERTPTNLNRMLKHLKDGSGQPVISEPKPEFRKQLLEKNKESRENLTEMNSDGRKSPTIIELNLEESGEGDAMEIA